MCHQILLRYRNELTYGFIIYMVCPMKILLN